jgi:hypothetical protein
MSERLRETELLKSRGPIESTLLMDFILSKGDLIRTLFIGFIKLNEDRLEMDYWMTEFLLFSFSRCSLNSHFSEIIYISFSSNNSLSYLIWLS